MPKLDIFINVLQQAGHRITPQRRAICEYLSVTDQHPTPYQVFANISTQYPEISRATVYNTLNTLQSLGAIVEINFGEDQKRYDTNAIPHINLICLGCHQIFDYRSDIHATDWSTDTLQNRVMTEMGFRPIATKVDMLGFCQACQAQRALEARQPGFSQQTEVNQPIDKEKDQQ
ncbi:MAG: Fur family transcriptional regulator [Chloroflexi bacterium]|nr:Fur family transcriptional regulator [Chloroflexota bacterium]